MPIATLKSDLPTKAKTRVTLADAATRKATCTTVYGMTAEQVMEALRIGIEQINADQPAEAA